MKRRVAGLHQLTAISSVELQVRRQVAGGLVALEAAPASLTQHMGRLAGVAEPWAPHFCGC